MKKIIKYLQDKVFYTLVQSSPKILFKILQNFSNKKKYTFKGTNWNLETCLKWSQIPSVLDIKRYKWNNNNQNIIIEEKYDYLKDPNNILNWYPQRQTEFSNKVMKTRIKIIKNFIFECDINNKSKVEQIWIKKLQNKLNMKIDLDIV